MADTEAAYDRYGAAYRRWMAPIVAPPARRLLDRLDGNMVGDGTIRLVDVGTGTGTLAIDALVRWPNASAIGVDQSQAMLDIAADEARQRGGRALAERLELVVSDAERLPLDDATVDLAVSSFVIQLASSRSAAVREIYRVLRPGGTAAVVTWQVEREPFEPDDVVDDVFDELAIDHPAGGGSARPYPSPAAATAEFRRIGFDDVRATREWLEHQFTRQSYLDLLEHWIEDDFFAELDDGRRAAARTRILRRLGRLRPSALAWRLPLVSVVARRPESSGDGRHLDRA
jgi:SAM-dependent methyltransferase